MKRRPSDRELLVRLCQAQQYLINEKWIPINPRRFKSDCFDLGLQTKSERSKALLETAKEMKPKHYAGYRPPQLSYEKQIKGMELFAFSCYSKTCGKIVYLKFAIDDNQVYIVSFHESIPKY